MKRIVVALALVGASPAPDKAHVVAYRTGNVIGSAIGCNVSDNGSIYGTLYTHTYMEFDVDPGDHRFVAKGPPVLITAKAGQTYYLFCSVGMGVVGARAHLIASTPQDFNENVSRLKRVN